MLTPRNDEIAPAVSKKGRARVWPWPDMRDGWHFDMPLTAPRHDRAAARTEVRAIRNRISGSFYLWRDGAPDRAALRIVVRVLWPKYLVRVWLVADREGVRTANESARQANHVPGPPMPGMPPAAPVPAPAPKPATAAAPAVASAEPEPTDYGDW